jgi:hypothetical protein
LESLKQAWHGNAKGKHAAEGLALLEREKYELE